MVASVNAMPLGHVPSEEKLLKGEITLIVQTNGKLRDRLMVPADIDEEQATQAALESENVQSFLEGKEPKKLIYVPGRLVNIVA